MFLHGGKSAFLVCQLDIILRSKTRSWMYVLFLGRSVVIQIEDTMGINRVAYCTIGISAEDELILPTQTPVPAPIEDTPNEGERTLSLIFIRTSCETKYLFTFQTHN